MEVKKEKRVEVLSPKEGVGRVEEKKILIKFPKGNKSSVLIVIAALFVVAFGVLSGWFLSGGRITKSLSKSEVAESMIIESDTEAGSTDTSLFSDNAEGKLVEGGISGEGTHHLEREGGPSKYVYLTSTVIDLQSFVDKNVQVWGETLSGNKAGWLMDVGRIKVIE